MPECYLIAVVDRSSLDKSTNTWSFFHIIENLTLEPAKELPTGVLVVPMEVHTFWLFSEGEVGVEYKWRMVFEHEGRDIPGENIFSLKSEKRHHRYRVQGFPIVATGTIKLRVEWRENSSEEWNRCNSFWPMTLEIKSPTEEGSET